MGSMCESRKTVESRQGEGSQPQRTQRYVETIRPGFSLLCALFVLMLSEAVLVLDLRGLGGRTPIDAPVETDHQDKAE